MASINAVRCVKIIENKKLSQFEKIKQLKLIFNKAPSCVTERVPLAGGGKYRGSIGTLLHAAIYNGHAHVIELLLKRGVDVHSKDNLGQPPIFAACDYSSPSTIQILKLLITSGANVNAKNKFGQPLLMCTFRNKHHIEIIELLLNNGAVVRIFYLYLFLKSGDVNGGNLLIRHLLEKCPTLEKPFYLIKSVFSPFQISSSYWDLFKNLIDYEVAAMKEENLGKSALSVYDILVADDKMLARYVQNEDVQKFISSDYRISFPRHAYVIKEKFRKGMARMTLENVVHIVMNHWQPPLLNLHVRQQIFEHLEIQDLVNLRKAGIISLRNVRKNVCSRRSWNFRKRNSPYNRNLRPRKNQVNLY